MYLPTVSKESYNKEGSKRHEIYIGVICFLTVLLLSGCEAFMEGFREGVERENGNENIEGN